MEIRITQCCNVWTYNNCIVRVLNLDLVSRNIACACVGVSVGSVVMSGGENEDTATEERISQILSEAQAAMQKKHSDEHVSTIVFFVCYNNNNNPFYGHLIQDNLDEPCSTYQKQSDTLTPAIITILLSTSNQLCPFTTNQRIFKVFISPPQSTTFFYALFGLPRGLTPSTTKSIHFFTHSLSSFLNTCPYHLNLLFVCYLYRFKF